MVGDGLAELSPVKVGIKKDRVANSLLLTLEEPEEDKERRALLVKL